jgi:hypothetical protein
MTDKVETEVIDVLEPPAQNYEVVLKEGTDEELRLVQKPLTFFGKMEFFSVMGKAVDKALNEGLSVSDLFDVPEDRQNLSAESFKEADLFVKAVMKLIKEAPELLGDMFAVILGVPRAQREYVKERLEEDLTDDQAFGILDHFVDQNWDMMTNFFKEKISPLTSKIGSKFQGSESSKPSKATRQSTRKR